MNPLLVNLAFLNQRPTGLMTYGMNVLPSLRSLHPVILSGQPLAAAIEPYRRPISGTMTADQGSRGHLRRLLWTQFQLSRLYRQTQASLLFSPIPEAPLGVGVPTVVTVHDLIPLRFPRRSPLTLYSRYYVPQVLRQARHILANSEATARDVTDYFGIPAQRITPIPLAYDADHFRPLNLPTQPYFLFLGRPDPHKNVHRLIDAFAQVPSHLGLELWLAGAADPIEAPQLMRHATEAGVQDRVKILDYVPYEDLPRLLNQAIALVFPSLWEGFGLPVLEAMACGTPVITSNLSSLPEVAGDAALLIDPYQVAAIAHAMNLVAADGEARSHLRSAGLQQAQRFSWAKTGQQTAEVLRQWMEA